MNLRKRRLIDLGLLFFIREKYILSYRKQRRFYNMSLAEKRFNKGLIRNYMREYQKTGKVIYLREAYKMKRLMEER